MHLCTALEMVNRFTNYKVKKILGDL